MHCEKPLITLNTTSFSSMETIASTLLQHHLESGLPTGLTLYSRKQIPLVLFLMAENCAASNWEFSTRTRKSSSSRLPSKLRVSPSDDS